MNTKLERADFSFLFAAFLFQPSASLYRPSYFRKKILFSPSVHSWRRSLITLVTIIFWRFSSSL